jgi:hypothetical protein
LVELQGGKVEKSHDSSRFGARPSEPRAGYAEWLALGAVAAGSVGALVGMAAYRRAGSAAGFEVEDGLEPESITAPHGDKLRGAVV